MKFVYPQEKGATMETVRLKTYDLVWSCFVSRALGSGAPGCLGGLRIWESTNFPYFRRHPEVLRLMI